MVKPEYMVILAKVWLLSSVMSPLRWPHITQVIPSPQRGMPDTKWARVCIHISDDWWWFFWKACYWSLFSFLPSSLWNQKNDEYPLLTPSTQCCGRDLNQHNKTKRSNVKGKIQKRKKIFSMSRWYHFLNGKFKRF